MKNTIAKLTLMLLVVTASTPLNARQWERHIVRRGQTLHKIYTSLTKQFRYNLDFRSFLREVEQKNPSILDVDRISIGQAIYLPVTKVAAKRKKPAPRQQPQLVEATYNPINVPASPLISQPVIELLEGQEQSQYLLTSLVGSFTRIDSKEKRDGAEASVLSKPGVGAEILLESRQNRHSANRVRVLVLEQRYTDDETKSFQSNHVRLHRFRFEKAYNWDSGWFALPHLALDQSAYLSAIDSSTLIVDSVYQPGAGLQIGYEISSTRFWSSIAASATYLTSSQGPRSDIGYGRVFEADLVIGWLWSDHVSTEIKTWQDYRLLETSTTSQKNRSVGCNLGLGFMF